MTTYKDLASFFGVKSTSWKEFVQEVEKFFGINEHIVFQICSDDYQRVAEVRMYYEDNVPVLLRFWHDDGEQVYFIFIYEHFVSVRYETRSWKYLQTDSDYKWHQYINEWVAQVKKIGNDLDKVVFKGRAAQDFIARS